MKYTIMFTIIAVLLGLFLVFGHNGILKYLQMTSIKANYEERISDIDKRIEGMQRELDLVRKDRDYLDYIIRRDLGMLKEGEELYIHDQNVGTK